MPRWYSVRPGTLRTLSAEVTRNRGIATSFLPAMLRQGSGTILTIASIAAKRALPGSAVYTATKAGVVGFSRVLAEELRAHGVRVGVLVPGAVDTPLWDALGSTPPRELMLRPEDVARAAVLMASLPPHASLEELTLLPAGGIL